MVTTKIRNGDSERKKSYLSAGGRSQLDTPVGELIRPNEASMKLSGDKAPWSSSLGDARGMLE